MEGGKAQKSHGQTRLKLLKSKSHRQVELNANAPKSEARRSERFRLLFVFVWTSYERPNGAPRTSSPFAFLPFPSLPFHGDSFTHKNNINTVIFSLIENNTRKERRTQTPLRSHDNDGKDGNGTAYSFRL